ncbi:hypothetical protein CR513_28077, partial [Mucuna pruriens]
MAKDSVHNKEMRGKAQGSSSRSKVLVTKNRRRSQKKGREKSKNTRMWSVTTVIEHGIYKSIVSCKKKENKGKKGKSKEKDYDFGDDHVTTAIGDGLVILRDFELVNLVSDKSMWIINSDATLYVTPRKEFFTSYTLGDFRVLKMDNDGVSKVIGVGDVCLQTNIGVQLWLRGVKHAPDVHFNLISMHMLDDGAYDNHFGYGKWKFAARGAKISKMYWTKALVAKDSVNVMDMEASLAELFSQKGYASKIKEHKVEKCSHCMASKQIIVSFKKHPPSRKSELLELVHFDVCDPLKLWVYTLKKKGQVLEKFKQFQALVERQSSKKVKCIHSDNGGEYYGPFDGEALYIVVHVINLNPVVALNTKVRDKIWFGKDVKYDHLGVFGCKAFVHVPKDERSKLDMKTRQYIFIGYGQDEYGYRLYDPIEKKLVRIRDVQFMEDQTIEDIDNVKKTTPEKDNSLSKIDPVRIPIHNLDTVENNVQNGEQHDYVDVFYFPLDDDAEEEQEMSQDENPSAAPKPPLVQLKKFDK